MDQHQGERDSSERLYTAACATIIVGARHANLVGANFDIPAIMKLLVDTYLKLRAGRRKSSLMDNGKFDIEEVIGRFASEYHANKVVTSVFSTSGPKPTNWEVFIAPAPRDRCEIHVSLIQKTIRIAKHTFVEWCKKNNISQTVALQAAFKDLGGFQDRKVLADGTDWSGGRVAIIEIPLTAELEMLVPDSLGLGGQEPPSRAVVTSVAAAPKSSRFEWDRRKSTDTRPYGSAMKIVQYQEVEGQLPRRG